MQGQAKNDWNEVEEHLKKQWLSENTDPSIQWEDVKDSIYYGWRMARHSNTSIQSIH